MNNTYNEYVSKLINSVTQKFVADEAKAILIKHYNSLDLKHELVFDLIFLDYEMPICDGKMTLEMIRELEESKDIPVVFLTGVSDKEHIAAVLERLANSGLISKKDVLLDYGCGKGRVDFFLTTNK